MSLLSQLFSRILHPSHTTKMPPMKLLRRVGIRDEQGYIKVGEKVCAHLIQHIEKHRSIHDVERVLDWGCGCGRVARCMLEHVSAPSFYGCDIDPEPIKWMKKAYPESSFENVKPYPPAPYEDGFFDLVYGISVFTHLDEETQFKWLEELRRITAEGGIVAVSVHEDRDETKQELKHTLNEKGIADMPGPNAAMFEHFLDDDYYRLTKHRKEYIQREWSKYFDVLEFIENGVGRQDLVIMRRGA